LDLRANGVNVVGIGYTIYLGSEYESQMLAEAGQLIADAHALGMIVVLWMYPRGKAVANEKDAHLIAGAAGVALTLGADFVKVNPPKGDDHASSAEQLKQAAWASGRTGLVCAGGSTVDAETFLSQLYDQIHLGGAIGNATGRNIHQRSLAEAVRLTKAISAITLGDWSVADALAVFKGEKDFTHA
jgi:class I fructose-bisphosphate aldolase